MQKASFEVLNEIIDASPESIPYLEQEHKIVLFLINSLQKFQGRPIDHLDAIYQGNRADPNPTVNGIQSWYFLHERISLMINMVQKFVMPYQAQGFG